jgi:V/A-type H+-transporting ATPase subunit E
MALDRLIAEIEARGQAELDREKKRLDDERERVTAETDARVGKIREEARRGAQTQAARERAQKIASAKLQARKLEYEAREQQLGKSLDASKRILREYASGPEYAALLKRMWTYATDRLGGDARVSGRPEDASALKSLAGKRFDPTPRPVLGGLVAESADGNRRLNLTFDELLRLREERIRALLASA